MKIDLIFIKVQISIINTYSIILGIIAIDMKGKPGSILMTQSLISINHKVYLIQ